MDFSEKKDVEILKGINHNKYLYTIWNNKTFVELNRHIDLHWGCGKDGDRYITNTDNIFEHIQQYTDIHNYENKVQASSSVFNFQKVDTSNINFYGLFNYNYRFSENVSS